MKLKYLMVAGGLLTLACGSKDAVDNDTFSQNWDEEEAGFSDTRVSCNDPDWEFEVDTYGDVSRVWVNVWVEETELGDFDLTDRGGDNWFAQYTSAEMGLDCPLTDRHLTWFLEDSNGNVVEDDG